MSTQSLAAATQDRKARLAQLKSLKRKQPSSDERDALVESPRPVKSRRSPSPEHDEQTSLRRSEDGPTEHSTEQDEDATPDVATLYLSGRNFDVTTGDVKLGFEHDPQRGHTTLETRANALAATVKAEAESKDAESKSIDLFSLQPKKPNWDLKRDLAAKLKILDVRTDVAIAKLVRDRIDGQKRAALETKHASRIASSKDGEEETGIAGSDLVEGIHIREQEAEEEARRDRDEHEDDGLV